MCECAADEIVSFFCYGNADSKGKKKESFTLKRWVPSIKSTLAVSEVLYTYSFLRSAHFFPRRRRRLLDQSHANTRAHTLGGRRWTRASADFWWFLLSLKFLEPNCSTDHKCHITPPLLRISPPPSLPPCLCTVIDYVYVCLNAFTQQIFTVLFIICCMFVDTWSNVPAFQLCFPPNPETSVRTRSRRFPGKLSEESPVSRTCKHNFISSILLSRLFVSTERIAL